MHKSMKIKKKTKAREIEKTGKLLKSQGLPGL